MSQTCSGHSLESLDPVCPYCKAIERYPRYRKSVESGVVTEVKASKATKTRTTKCIHLGPTLTLMEKRSLELSPGPAWSKCAKGYGVVREGDTYVCPCWPTAAGCIHCKDYTIDIERGTPTGRPGRYQITIPADQAQRFLKNGASLPGVVSGRVGTVSSTPISFSQESSRVTGKTEPTYHDNRKSYKWSYGVTTNPKRFHTLLPSTLDSLKAGGFDKPHLFVDDCTDSQAWGNYFGLSVTARSPKTLPYPHWVLSLMELLFRNKDADRFALFQDDLVCVKGLKEYLDHCDLSPKTYWNLYTFPNNLKLCPKDTNRNPIKGWFDSSQRGWGALGLVFSREGVIDLLTSRHLFDRLYSSNSPIRWWRFIDGAVVDSLKKCGYTELVHSPSLLQHTGIESTIDHSRGSDGRNENFTPYRWNEVTFADSFPGVDYDAMNLVKDRELKA